MKRTMMMTMGWLLAAGCAAGGPGDGADGESERGADVSTPCPDDRAFFVSEVRAPLLAKRCVGCHREGGLAGASRLVLSETDERAGFAGAVALAGESAGGVPALLARPAGLHPDGHPGGTLTPPGTAGYARLQAFVARVAGVDCAAQAGQTCDASTPGKRRLRRLTRRELDRTLRDLFALPEGFSAGLAADTVVAGFDNRADVGLVTPLVASQVATMAEQLSAKIVAGWAPCAGAGSACVDAVLDGVGRRLFRRPLSSGERARYRALYAAAEEDQAGVGREAVLGALLQSPSFLYRAELGGAAAGGVVTLDGYERATALSYLAWGTTPDDALLDAAATGALDTPAGLSAQLERLLADPRASGATEAFVSQWLDVGRLDSAPKDAAVYPAFDAGLRAAMREETRRFVDHVVRERHGTLGDLLTSRETFVGGALGDLYGAPAGAVQPWTQDAVRAGLLTQASVLAVHGGPAGSSPIQRGKLVRERLLCQPLPPPPANVSVKPPPVDPTKSTRERFAAHGAVEPCLSCHRLMDPIGFAFEGFDGIGRARATEAGHPVDTRGSILDAGSASGDVTGAAEVAARLAASPEVRACFASQWVRFGFGVDEEEELPCLTDGLRMSFQEGDGSVEGLLRALVATPHFTTRRADPEQQPAPMAPDAPSMGAAGAAGAAGAGGAAGASGAAGATSGDSVTVTTTTDTSWPGGSCSTAKIVNAGAAAATWQVSLEIGGELTDVWNAVDLGAKGPTRAFRGVEWNASLPPGGSTSFGFCVAK